MKLYKLCAALATVLVFAVVGSATASAAEFHATYGGTLVSYQEERPVFLPGNYSRILCKAGALQGSVVKSSPTQEVHPELWECTWGGTGSTPWKANTAGCAYKFFASGSIELQGCINGGIKFESESTIFQPQCTVEIPNQTAVGGITYENFTNTKGERNYRILVSSTFNAKSGGNELYCPSEIKTVKTTQRWAISAQASETWVS